MQESVQQAAPRLHSALFDSRPAVLACGMALDATARRRWGGALALAAALAMLVAGETFLKGRLSPLASLAYSLICLCLTALAMAVAILDLRAVRRRSREEQRELFEKTLQNIETEAKTRRRRDGDKGTP